MKRKATIIKSSKDGKRNIAIDKENYNVLMEFLTQDKRHKSKFIDICNIILNGLRNSQLYDKEAINKKCRHVTAMKFFKGQENARIYCQEVTRKDKTFVVVASELIERKKSAKLTHKEKNLIEKVAGYEFIIE
ncbi:hypothetical protein ACT29H_03450 [Thermophagus sp. OGC60D27]|uniref:hypothetical protein n=1 Tax=Thermophagus sp. OGC60D27 TaxID=3458415 RepID=UPI004037C777